MENLQILLFIESTTEVADSLRKTALSKIMKTFKDTLVETFKRNMKEATRKGGPRVCLCVILTNGDEYYGLAKEIINDSFVLDVGDEGDKRPITLTVPVEKIDNIIEWSDGPLPKGYK